MLKGQYISGTHHDETISLSVVLKNPADYGYDISALLLGVFLKAKNSGTITPKLEDFTFYVMDENNYMYNTQNVPTPTIVADTDADETPRQIDGLILTAFEPDFLFQDLRIAFYCRTYGTISIMNLRY